MHITPNTDAESRQKLVFLVLFQVIGIIIMNLLSVIEPYHS